MGTKLIMKNRSMKKSNKDPDCSFVRMWRHGLLLGLLFAIAGSFSTSYAQNTPSACSANEAGCRLNGGFNAASARNLDANGAGISYTSSPSFGAFIYEDFKPLEAEARSHLNRALGVRESISPYQGKIG